MGDDDHDCPCLSQLAIATRCFCPLESCSGTGAAVSGMGIKPERAKVIDFSDLYFETGLVIAVAQSNTDVDELADLEGKKIAAQLGYHRC